jgi:Fic family protein
MFPALPDSIPISAEMLRLVREIDEFKGHWRAWQALTPDRLKGLRHVATIESIGSSTRIEGSRLSDREVEALLSRLETQSFATRDEQEVAGYAFVMEQVFAHASEIPLTANMLKQLHRDLLQYCTKDERHRGEWKSLPNHVAAFDADGCELGIVFETSAPFDTPVHMGVLLDWHSRAEADSGLHPLLRIGIFVVVFLAVHPFQDGNGRLSRILTTLLMLRAGYGHVPYSSLESIIEQNSRAERDSLLQAARRADAGESGNDAYYLALRRTQTTWRDGSADWPAWLMFFLRSIRQQITRLQQRLDASRPQLSPLARQLASLFETHETLTNAQATALTGANRSTLKAKFAELINARLIEAHGKGRGAYYAKARP